MTVKILSVALIAFTMSCVGSTTREPTNLEQCATFCGSSKIKSFDRVKEASFLYSNLCLCEDGRSTKFL